MPDKDMNYNAIYEGVNVGAYFMKLIGRSKSSSPG
jgi:hypothetical protein